MVTDSLPAPDRPRDAGDPFRYGVFLRPDARTCRAVTVATDQLRAQYGFVSAGAFPPHATLVGSRHLGRDEDAVVAAVGDALHGRSAFEVHNAGLRRLGVGYVYDVGRRPDGSPNGPFLELAAAVDRAVAPLSRPAGNPEPHPFDPATFSPHLSLASHDLHERPDLHEEVGAYLAELDVPVPAGFTASTVSLYRTSSEDWSGRWWRTLRWEHLHSWTLPQA